MSGLLLLIFGVVGTVAAADPIALPPPAGGVVPMGAHMEFLVDPAGALSFEAAKSGDGYVRSDRPIPSFGYLNGAIWGRCRIRNASDRPQTFVLELEMSRLSHLEWFVETPAAGLRRSYGGSHDLPAPTYRVPSVRFTLGPGEVAAIHCRIATDTSIWLPFVAGASEDHWAYRLARDSSDYVYLGFGLAIACLGFGLVVIYRRMVFVYAALLPLAYMGFFTIFFGYYHHLWPDCPAWVGREGLILVNAAVAAAYLFFMRRFLYADERTASARFLQWAAVFAPIAMLAIAATMPFKWAIHFCHAAIVVSYVFGAVLVFFVARRRRLPEDWMLAASCALVAAGIVLLMLEWVSVLPMLVPPLTIFRVVSVVIFVFPLLSCVYAQRSEYLLKSRLALAHQATAEAELAALRAQLNPHFLMNTLNSVDALSHEDPARIPELVRRLADFLRRSLLPAGAIRHTVEEEVAAVRNYLAIEQVRHGDRLQVSFDVAPEALRLELPEFMLQPLVENALKHGFRGQPDLQVRILVAVMSGRLVVRVENLGRLVPPSSDRRSTGVGVENVRRRLGLLYGESAGFELREVDGWVRAEIRLPLP